MSELAASPPALLLCAIAFLAGGFAKGALGFGLPLVAVPIMASVVDPTLAIALVVIPMLGSNVWQATHGGELAPLLRRFWPVFATLVPATVGGSMILARLDAKTSAPVLGTIVIVFCLLQFRGAKVRLPPSSERWLGPATGVAAGILGGLATFFGPPLVMYVLSLRIDKEAFVRTISALTVIGTLTLGLSLARHDLFGWPELLGSGAAGVPTLVGLYAGERLRRHIVEAVFRKAVLIVLVLIGLNLVRRGLM